MALSFRSPFSLTQPWAILFTRPPPIASQSIYPGRALSQVAMARRSVRSTDPSKLACVVFPNGWIVPYL
jgi:hypothetical protein